MMGQAGGLAIYSEGNTMAEGLELQRSIDSLTREIRSLREDLVRKDVYEADEKRRNSELADLENDVATIIRERGEEARERRADRRILIGAFLASLSTVIINLYTQAGGKT